MTADRRPSERRDKGAVLLLVLAVTVVLSLVVLALANFVAADLRYSQVVDARAKTLSSAESGIDYAVDRLRLNQTLCATDAATAPVSLTGSGGGTALPQQLNTTDVSVTCQRLDGAIADVAGWAVVITNYGESPPNDQIQINMDDHVHVYGPVFLPDPDPSYTVLDSNSRVEVVDGDLWYTKASCGSPYSNSNLATNKHIDINPGSARGGICSTLTSGPLFSAPTIQDPLPTNIVPDVSVPTNGLADGIDVSGCRVFSPGRYDLVPDLTGATDVYFKSGDYHLNFDTAWQISGDHVWAGYPDPGSVGSLGACNAAATADKDGGYYNGRAGATFYVDRTSHIWVEAGASLEIFPRRQGNHVVSVHALDTTWQVNDPCNCYRSVLRTLSGSAGLTVHGLVWAPRGRINIDNLSSGVDQQLLGGVVLQTLWLLRADHHSFEIRPATSTVDTSIRLRSTSTSADGVSTTVEAVVQYRPQATNIDQRVRVTSFRVDD